MLLAAIALSGFAGAAQAGTPDITTAVSNDCRWDYHNYCSEYGIGSPLLNYCFRNNGAKLSKACVNASGCRGRRVEKLRAGAAQSRALRLRHNRSAPRRRTALWRRRNIHRFFRRGGREKEPLRAFSIYTGVSIRILGGIHR